MEWKGQETKEEEANNTATLTNNGMNSYRQLGP